MLDFKEFLLSCPKIDDQRIFERQKDFAERSPHFEEYELHPDIEQLKGLILPDIDARQEYYDYLEKKHS